MSNTFKVGSTMVAVFLLMMTVSIALPAEADAHCLRENGPVATAAIKALRTGELQPVAIWVGKEQEQALRERFRSSLKAYREGGPGKEVAKQYFMSEAVRLHRAAEGMPFTGLKPASESPEDIKRAEKALKTGDVQPVVDLLTNNLEQKVDKWFKRSREAKRRMEAKDSLEAGRQWADAYVKYIVYVHKLYQKIQAGPPHGVGDKSGGSHGQ